MMEAFARLVDGVQVLVREHLALARVELKGEVRALGRNLSLAAIGIPLLLTGWILLMGAVALALPLAPWASLGLVGVANLGAGALLTRVSLRRAAAGKPGLPDTGKELQRDREMLLATVDRPERQPPAAPGNGQALAAAGPTPHR